jgi:uncharacterized protein YjiS (DUF1127 family)
MNCTDTIQSQVPKGTLRAGKNSRLTAVTQVSQTNTILNSVKRVIMSVLHVLLNWHHDRMERVTLRSMDERMLKDIGITRNQADHMAAIPWERRNVRKARQSHQH